MNRFSTHLRKMCVLVAVLFSGLTYAQNVLVSGALVGNGLYPDMGTAFTAINSGAQTNANIVIAVLGNTTETATATLNANNWNSVSIVPAGGAARTISGNIAGALISFDGADRVGVDGLNSGGNSLTIDNTSIGAASTIQFVNDAHLIACQNLTILGANTSTTSGTILLGAGTVTGNDSITFNACTIGASGANFPTNGIYSAGNTTAGIENSMIAINSCNIENFFSATTVTEGILAAAGNTDWTVQGCRLYQSAMRTYLTANTHRGIHITSGNNHTVSANTIGYASAAGAGTYTMASTVATRFIAIDLAVGTVVASNVNGNLFTAFALGTSSGATTTNGIICGINITAGNVNVGTTLANTIGGATGANLIVGTATTAGGMVVAINSQSTGTIVIQNNIIGGLTSSGTTASISGAVTGINVSGAALSMTITGNTIGNTTVDNMRGGTLGLTTGSCSVSGINLPSTPTTTIISGNTIRNLSSYGTGTSGFVRGIQTTTSTTATATMTISGNTINTLTTNSTFAGQGSALCGAMGIHMLSALVATISQNTISNIANVNTGTGNYVVTGIGVGSSSSTVSAGTLISQNVIYDLRNAGTGTTVTAPPVVAGVLVRSGNAVTSIVNNMISFGNGQTTNTTYIGVYGNHGSTPNPTQVNVYHNTINIEGAAASGALPSFCLNRGDLTTNSRTIAYDIRNNIFTNTRTGGTGQHFAISNNFGVASSQPTGWSSNYNALNANAATIGSWNGAFTFSNWQTTSLSDANSYSGITVTYVNSANDLHLNMGVTPTVLESGATTIATIVTDIDGQARPGPIGSVNGGAFAPDLGADEFDGVYLDALDPTITYTPFTFTCSTSDRTLTATIADFTGVPTTGIFQPRVYFRKNADPWLSAAGTLATGNATNGTWNFIISSTAMGGLVAGDMVSYYVIAQDVTTPVLNIGSNPSAGLVATDVNTVTTAPTTPNSYAIGGTLSGTYTVGATGNFPTLTAAVNAYNFSCLSGAVVFSLIDATYPSETFPITVNANPNASAVNTLTIKPAVGVNATISGSSATAIINMSGADYVTIDGSNAATTNSLCPRVTATRNLVIENTNTSVASAVVALTTTAGADAATNNAIMNTQIQGSGSLATGVAVNISGPGIGNGAGANGNNNNRIINNKIIKAQVGIFAAGSGAATKNLNNVYELNNIDSTGTNGIGRFGMMILYEDAPTVRGNRVANIVNTATNDACGISLGANAFSNTLTTSAEVTNAVVTDNVVDSIRQTNTYSAGGIVIAATTSGTTTVSNNTVNDVFANGTAGDFAVGLYYGGGAGALNVYHNTLVVNGVALTGASQPNMAVGINGATPTVDIRNNILVCGGSNGFNGNTGIGLAYTSTTGNYANLTSNYNDIFVAGTTASVGRTGGLALGVQRVTLGDWQTETGRDVNSISTAPTFVSAGDLHLVAGSNAGIEDAALPIATVTTDIDCNTRDLCFVDMGADEFGTPREAGITGNSIAIADGDITPSSADFTNFDSTSVCNGTVVRTFTIQNSGTNALGVTGVTITGTNASDFTVTTAPATSVAAAGTTTFSVTFDPSAAGVRTATITVNTDDCDEAAYDFAVQGTGAQVAILGTTQTDVSCNAGNNGTATVTAAGGMPSLTYAWSSGGTAATESGLIAGTYTVTVSDANGCTVSTTVTLTEPSAIVATATASDPLCSTGSGSATANVSGGTAPYSYLWPSGGTAQTEAGLAAGTYTVIVTDAASCTSSATVTITVPTAVTSSMAFNSPLCFGGTGDATVTASGGTGAYTYLWSSGGTNATESGLAAGSYTVTITDANGCTGSNTITVNEPALLTATLLTAGDPSTCGGADGSINIDVAGGTAAYTYLWSNTNTTEDIAGLIAGTYSCVVTDANGCTSSVAPVTLNDPAAPTVTLSFGLDTVCQSTTSPFTLTGESPAGGVYSGPGVTAGVFDPMAATLGMNVITYSYTDSVTLCTATATDSILVDVCTGVQVSGLVAQVSVFPNPNNGTFVLTIDQSDYSDLTIELVTVDGKSVYTNTVSNATGKYVQQIDMSGMANGTYVLRVTSGNNTVAVKRIVRAE